MVFGSLFFVFAFLPPVLLGHWLLQGGGSPRRTAAANAWLLAASLAFCVLSDLPGLPVFLATSFLVWALARPSLPFALRSLSAVLPVAALCFFKYAGTLARWIDAAAGCPLVPVPALSIPLGMSFWTFRAVSYSIDVSRGVHPPERSFPRFLCWLALFPVFVSGPIVRWGETAAQMRSRPFDASLSASGMRRFFVGLAKKVLVANQLSPMADAVWGLAAEGRAAPPSMAALGVLAWTLQLYFDFSGYSDMAIGVGRMLGFRFRENFIWPYAARGIRDFWRRWHVSLSSWLRDYVYFPLGGSRFSRARAFANGMAVFAVCGVWHGTGAMFLAWGLWHGLLVGLERLAFGKRVPGALWRVPTLCAVAFGWILFRSASPGEAACILESLFGLVPASRESRVLWLDCTPAFQAALAAGTALCFPVAPALRRAARRVLPDAAAWALESLAATALAAAALFFLASGTRRSFLYFQF